MVIAIDVDGTIDRCPTFYACMSKALSEAGHRVVVVTLRGDVATTRSDLQRWGITYHKLVTFTDSSLVAEEIDAWKSNVCRTNGVDVFIDDDPVALQHVDSSVVCLMAVDANKRNLPAARRPVSLP